MNKPYIIDLLLIIYLVISVVFSPRL